MAMIAAIEFDYRIASRERARYSYGAHCSFGAAGDEAKHLDVRHASSDQLAKLELQLGRHSKRRTVSHRPVESVEHHRMRVSKHQGSPGQHIVDVFLAIRVPDARSLTSGCNDR